MTIIYEVATGSIICSSEMPMQKKAIDAMLSEPGRAAIYGSCSPDDGYVKNGELILKGPAPSENHVFNVAREQWELSVPSLTAEVLSMRKRMLLNSDWTQLPDVPIATRDAWATYRQALRDITEQPGFPLDIVWPTPPA